jgi:hypothetical protein
VNSPEAKAILRAELARYRERSYSELRDMIGKSTDVVRVTGPSGIEYHIGIHAVWDARPDGDARILGCVDDAGWRAFFPLGDSFIKTPDGSFVGEG